MVHIIFSDDLVCRQGENDNHFLFLWIKISYYFSSKESYM